MEIPGLKRELKGAYDRVFSESVNSQRDVDLVLNDIMSKTFINKPINGDEITRAEKEGMRKLGIHISNMLRLKLEYFIELDELSKKRTKQSKENLI